MSGIQNAMTLAGYVQASTAAGACRLCCHRTVRDERLRCTKGAFFVVPQGYCKHFYRGPAVPSQPTPSRLIQIGPTDI